ncbi:MAG: hypothetical protein K0U15_01885, partial [Proteobacteria bacterium]|nr:hypothetical protein [Pseudomonadota bacterium]
MLFMESFTAGFLIIGNEILSGRTIEKNLPVLTHMLNARGWRLAEVRVVPDVEAEIVAALNALRSRYAQVFTSGGIGPTHDDITTDSVAAAFELPVIEHADAVAILAEFYQARDLSFTNSRRRMTRTPVGAEVLTSDFPGAPAYRIDNVVVCAGVPSIFNLMATAAVAMLPLGVVRQSQALSVRCGESVFADYLSQVSAAFADVEIGSYPREENNAYVCQVVFTASIAERRNAAQQMFCDYLLSAKLPFEELP